MTYPMCDYPLVAEMRDEAVSTALIVVAGAGLLVADACCAILLGAYLWIRRNVR